jgi:RNA polymerase sigma-70 factor (ECF subfamily)
MEICGEISEDTVNEIARMRIQDGTGFAGAGIWHARATGPSALPRAQLVGANRNPCYVVSRRSTQGNRVSSFRSGIEAAIPALRRYARALTRDAETADDLVQDTLVRALRCEHLFHGGEVRSWLYTILTNLNRNRLRSLARRPIITPIEDSDAADMAGPEAGGRDIERALATLVEDQRAALLLVVLEGLSYREVADVQGVPIGTVMSRLARARAQLKAYLDGGRPALRRVK